MPWLETVDKVPIPHNAKVCRNEQKLKNIRLDAVRIISIMPVFQVSDLIIQTDDTAKQRFFIKLFLNALIPILFVGPTGTGKSSIILNYLMSLPRDKYMPNVINFSARTSANQTQEIIMSKLDRLVHK